MAREVQAGGDGAAARETKVEGKMDLATSTRLDRFRSRDKFPFPYACVDVDPRCNTLVHPNAHKARNRSIQIRCHAEREDSALSFCGAQAEKSQYELPGKPKRPRLRNRVK